LGKLMSCREYAEYKGLSYKMVLRLAKVKGFPALRVGERRIYILPEKADLWFEQQADEAVDDCVRDSAIARRMAVLRLCKVVFGETMETKEIVRGVDVLEAQIEDALGNLPPRREAVLRFRFGLDGTGCFRTLGEVGEHFDITRERVRQITSDAISRLRRQLENKQI